MVISSSKLWQALAAALLSGASAFAAPSTTQTVTFAVNAINEISVIGTLHTMTVSTSAAGAVPNSATDNSTRYAITTNGSNRKITAALDTAMPAGVKLTVSLVAPVGATSAGAIILGTTPTDVVTGITGLNESARGIAYELSATPEAGVVASQTRTITLTVTAGTI